MLLQLTHTTDLTYSDLISESVMELRMCPRQEGDQHRLSFTLAIGPRTGVTPYFDWLGNSVHSFTVNKFHRAVLRPSSSGGFPLFRRTPPRGSLHTLIGSPTQCFQL